MSVNVERLNKVADMIQAYPEHFDMTYWVRTPTGKDTHWVRASDCAQEDLSQCGTTACIAGWACNLWGADVDPGLDVQDAAAAILGLDEYEAYRLFYADFRDADHAADHLRRMALAAEVDQ